MVQLHYQIAKDELQKADESCIQLKHIEFKEFDASFVVVNPSWLAQAKFNVRSRLLRQCLPKPRHTSVLATPTVTVTAFAIPEWVGGVPLLGWSSVSARLAVKIAANE